MDLLKGLAGILAVVSLVALIIGCGGGGSGGSSSGGSGGSGGTGGTSGDTAFQVTVVAPDNPSYMINPQSLFVGDVLQLEITARNSNEALVTVPSSGWTTNAPSGIATVSSSGALTVVGPSNGVTYTVQGSANGKKYQTTIASLAVQDVVTGLVRNTSGIGIEYANVLFYNSAGNQVGQTQTTRLGSFRASVPPTAKKFTIDMSVADPGANYYYLSFGYGSSEYLDGTTCLAPLPSPLLTTGTNQLPNDIVPDLKDLGPPPPPNGCLGP